LEPLSNIVVAQLAVGLKIITPLGTGDENALDVTVAPQKLIVAPELGTPLALIWALNHMESPAGIAVPLNFDGMHEDVAVGHGVHGGVEEQQTEFGRNVIGTVLYVCTRKPPLILYNPNVAEPERLLLPVRGGANGKGPPSSPPSKHSGDPAPINKIALIVIGVPDDGVAVIS
jgi:hypothetical protein